MGNCPTESINAKLANTPQGKWVNVNVTGTCHENVEIAEWATQLRNISFHGGGTGASVALAECGVTNTAGVGVEAGYGSFNALSGCSVGPIGSNSAVKAFEGSNIFLTEGNSLFSNIPDSGDGALAAYGGSVIRLQGTNSVSNSTSGGAGH